MKFTLAWLKDHLDTKASLDEISETLSSIGLEVDDIYDPARPVGSLESDILARNTSDRVLVEIRAARDFRVAESLTSRSR